MVNARTEIEQFGGMIDVALRDGAVNCQEVVARFDHLAAAPTLDVSGGSGEVQAAYNQYRQSIAIFTQGAKDMTQNCRDFLADPGYGSIPVQQWGLARMRVNDALDVLNAAIPLLE
jgi:hypothetical protein